MAKYSALEELQREREKQTESYSAVLTSNGHRSQGNLSIASVIDGRQDLVSHIF